MSGHIDQSKLMKYTDMFKRYVKGKKWLDRQAQDLQRNIVDPLDDFWEEFSDEEREAWLEKNRELIGG